MSAEPSPPARPRRAAFGGDAAHHQALRFLLVGATTVAIDFVVYQLLLALNAPLDLAKALSFVVATICAYLFNRSFTFRAGGGRDVLRRFVFLYTVALAVNVAVNALVLRVVTTVEATRLDIIVAFLVAQVVSSTLNFLGMRHWVFKHAP